MTQKIFHATVTIHSLTAPERIKITVPVSITKVLIELQCTKIQTTRSTNAFICSLTNAVNRVYAADSFPDNNNLFLRVRLRYFCSTIECIQNQFTNSYYLRARFPGVKTNIKQRQMLNNSISDLCNIIGSTCDCVEYASLRSVFQRSNAIPLFNYLLVNIVANIINTSEDCQENKTIQQKYVLRQE